MMKTKPVYLVLICLTGIAVSIALHPSLGAQSTEKENTFEEPTNPEIKERDRSVRIYPVPPAFRPGYLPLLQNLVVPVEAGFLLREESAGLISDASERPSSLPIGDEGTPVKEIEYVQFDPQRRIVTVLASQEDHQKVRTFLHQLSRVKFQSKPVVYRIAFARRDRNPKLKNYPWEFRIKGKCWGDGRYSKSKYPKYLNDRSDKYPSIFFRDVDVDKESKETMFRIQGYVKDKTGADKFLQAIKNNPDTQFSIRWIHHDFFKESGTFLRNAFAPVFKPGDVVPLIKSLQKMEIYDVDLLASNMGESSIPGTYRLHLEGDHSVEIKVVEGIHNDGTFQAEVTYYKKREKGDSFFEEKNIHLASSLLTRFGQLNLLGIRHDNGRRYILVIAIEEGKI